MHTHTHTFFDTHKIYSKTKSLLLRASVILASLPFFTLILHARPTVVIDSFRKTFTDLDILMQMCITLCYDMGFEDQCDKSPNTSIMWDEIANAQKTYRFVKNKIFYKLSD